MHVCVWESVLHMRCVCNFVYVCVFDGGGVLVQKGVYCNKVIKVSEIKAKTSLIFGIS